MKEALDNLNKYCSALERDYSHDADIVPLLAVGSPEGMLAAARRVCQRENSAFLKLPIQAAGPALDCPEISSVPGLVLSSKDLQNALKCLELADEPVMLRLSGPFSCFMAAAGTDATFRWLHKKGPEVKQALGTIADGLAEYAVGAAPKGARIISVAEPCAMAEVLGEKKYREFAAEYLIRFLRQALPHVRGSIVHLCPRASRQLEEFGCMAAQKISVPQGTYANVLLSAPQIADGVVVGHRCVNMEQATVDTLILLDFAGGG